MDQDTKQVQEEEIPQEPTTPTQEKSRTQEQFEKLTESNQELKTEVERVKEENAKYKSVLDSIRPDPEYAAPQQADYQNLDQAQIDDVYASMQDENGYIDGNKLLSTLKSMDEKARKADERAARVEEHLKRREIAETEAQKNNVTREVHNLYPQLDPESAQFDPDFWTLVRNELIGQAVEGKEDFKGAAEKWYSRYYKENDVTKQEKQEKQEKEEKENQKKQINAVRPTSSIEAGYYAADENTALVSKIRAGKKGALAELLRRRGQ